MEPLTGPFPLTHLTNQVVQARVTPEGFTFIAQKLPAVVGSFMETPCDGATGTPCSATQTCRCPAGQTCDRCPAGNRFCTLQNPPVCENNPGASPTIAFRVPPSDGDDTDICLLGDPDDGGTGATWDNCVIFATLKTTTFAPVSESAMDVRVKLDISSPPAPNGIKILYDPLLWFATYCTVYPHVTNRDVTARIQVGRESRTDRVTFEVTSVDVAITGADLTIDGGLTCSIADWGFIKDQIVSSFTADLSEQLRTALNDALAPVRTQACTPYAGGYQCPARPPSYTSLCYTDALCRFTTGAQEPVPGLLGAEGRVDLGAQLPAILATQAEVQFSLYAGGTRAGGGNAARFMDGGLNLGLVGGAYAEPNACVAPRNKSPISVPTFSFPATIAPASGGAASTYMVGLAAHDALLGELAGEAYSAGLLCQEISSGRVGLVNSGIVGLLLGEGETVANLMDGRTNPPRPAIMELHPRAVPEVQVGLGTTGPDPQDATRTLLLEPLLTINVPNLDIDIYVLADDRYVRLVTLTVDLAMGLGLDLTGDGEVHLVANPVDTWIREVRASHAEMLAQSAEEVAAAVPELLAAFLPQFAPSLDQVFALPGMNGFSLRNVRFRGVGDASRTTVLNHPRFDFLGTFADLAFDPALVGAATLRLATQARLERLELPPPEAMRASLGRDRQRVRAVIAVDTVAPEGLAVETSYRVDRGPWRPYHPGPRLVVADAELQLQGWHAIELRSRAAGHPGSADLDTVTLRVLSDVEAPTVEVARHEDTVAVRVWDRVTPAAGLEVRVRLQEGDWTDLPGTHERQLELPELPPGGFLEVEVRDEAGHVGRASLGTPVTRAPALALGSVAAGEEAPGCPTGCAGTAASPGGALVFLGLGAALRLRRRRIAR
jgi:hypothetical protein